MQTLFSISTSLELVWQQSESLFLEDIMWSLIKTKLLHLHLFVAPCCDFYLFSPFVLFIFLFSNILWKGRGSAQSPRLINPRNKSTSPYHHVGLHTSHPQCGSLSVWCVSGGRTGVDTEQPSVWRCGCGAAEQHRLIQCLSPSVKSDLPATATHHKAPLPLPLLGVADSAYLCSVEWSRHFKTTVTVKLHVCIHICMYGCVWRQAGVSQWLMHTQ